jgi:D-alanyl-D-alanine carboxypeptidase
LAVGLALGGGAQATPYLVVDADSDQVLMQNEATAPWYPASLTKLMTVYVALDAVRNGKLTLETPLVMSARAARMPPSKMGFRPGTQVTLDNALKMLMVKSPNDVAVMVAEGVSGSVEAFADDMNADAQRLGMRESHFVNPNGLHNPAHVSSARDMAIVARALLHEFPDHADLFDIGAIQLGNRYIPNHNGLLGRYPGADGMKTGFTCPAGFNVVASANHGRRLIVVVLGAPSARARNQEAADLFDRGFATGGGEGSLESLPAGSGPAPNMRAEVCLHRNAAAVAAAEDDGIPDQAVCCRRPWRRCWLPSQRTPSCRTEGSISTRCASISVRRPGGRDRLWAPVRQRKRRPPRAAPRSYPPTAPPPARLRRKATQANPSGLHPGPGSSIRGMPKKRCRRTSRSRAPPRKCRKKPRRPTRAEMARGRPKA